ncbi:MAG: hypothetical protein AAFV53_38590 [Myxococcota bacterium]
MLLSALLSLTLTATADDAIIAEITQDTRPSCYQPARVYRQRTELEVLQAVDVSSAARTIVFRSDQINVLGLPQNPDRILDLVPGYTRGHLGGHTMADVAILFDGVVMLPGTIR